MRFPTVDKEKKSSSDNKVTLTRWAILLLPLLIDAIDWFFFETINQKFVTLLQTPSEFSMILIMSSYGIFVIAMILTGLLESDYQTVPFTFIDLDTSNRAGNAKPGKMKITWPELLFFYPTVGFGIIMLTLTTYASGITGDKMVVSDNFLTALFMVGFVFFCLQLFMFANPLKPRIKSGTTGYLVLFGILLVIGAFVINVSVAAWQYLFGDLTREIAPNREGRLLDFIFAFPLFLLFFSSPRFLFMNKNFSWYSLAGALTLMAYFVWKSLDYVFII